MKHILFVLFAAMPVFNHVFATDRYFSDFESKSPNGLYTATAKSPDNADPKQHRVFQGDFTVTLTKQGEETPIWVWKQTGQYSASPVRITLTDDGYAVMQDSHDGFRVFSPTGKASEPVNFFTLIPQDQRERYTEWTTAGVMWQQCSKEGFHTRYGVTWFYVRTYWGFIIPLALESGLPLLEPGLQKAIEEQVVRETKERIKNFDGQFTYTCTGCSGEHLKAEINQDLYIIEKHNIQEGKDFMLKALEKHGVDSAGIKRALEGKGL